MPIYLDNNATTAIDPAFIEQLSQFLSSAPMNPSSVHANGQEAKKILLSCRHLIAEYLGVSPREITFTSGGTESMNSLIFGIVKSQPFDQILTTKIEHACVYESCIELKKQHYPVEFISLEGAPTLSCELLKKAIKKEKICIITSSVNSETGALLPLEELASFAQSIKATLIIDGVAHLGKAPLQLYPGIAAMGFSSHKIHAPKGAGFYYLKESTPFQKLLFGGFQESGKRAGTENLFAIFGLKLAIEKLQKERTSIFSHLQSLKESFLKTLDIENTSYEQNAPFSSISNTLNLHFKGICAETLLILLDQNQILTSMGSACASGALEPSRVLLELGFSKARAKSSLRISFSRLNTIEEVKIAAKKLSELLQQLSILK
jgi:cysteine desulfurase